MKTTVSSRSAVNGSALIITLFFVGMITVVIVGVLISSRLERSVAHSHFDQKRASDFAREGVERVVATLGKQTAYQYSIQDPAVANVKDYRYRNYLTRPGGLVVPTAAPTGTATDAITQNILAQSVPLSTGVPLGTAYADPVYAPPSLNIPSFVQQSYPTYLIDDRLATQNVAGASTDTTKPPAMKLKWVYIHQDLKTVPALYEDPVDQSVTPDTRANDSRSTDLPKIDTTRPIIGRFAYWTDDESTKINYNLAWKKGPTATPLNLSLMADPSHVDLEALLLPGQSSAYLTQAQSNTLHNWTTSTGGSNPARYFNSFEDARQVGQVDNSIPPIVDYNKFELTHYNHDPDTTFFGEDRILLTTNPRLVPKNPDGSYARKFLDIMREDQTGGKDFRTIDPPDPGMPYNIAAGENDASGNAVPSGSIYYPGVSVVNKLDMVVKNLVRYINQTNWPMCSDPTASFQKKYYPSAAATNPAVAQLALAIIDYVRMRESTEAIVPGTRAGYLPNSTTFSTNTSATTNSSTAYQGYGRYPYCTEMGVVIENAIGGGATQCADGTSNGWPKTAGGKNQTLYRCCAQYEYYLPVRSNLTNGLLFATPPGTSGERWVCNPIQNGDHGSVRYVEGEDQKMQLIKDSPGYDFGNLSPAISTKNCKIYNPSGVTAPGPGYLMPGGYAVVTIPYFRVQDSSVAPAGFAIRNTLERTFLAPDGLTVLLNAQGNSTDPHFVRALICPQSSSPAVAYKPQTFFGGDFAAFCATMPSVESDDPRCCVAAVDWVTPTPGGKQYSWGGKNTRWSAGKPAAAVSSPTPQQDTDSSGNVSDYSLYMPPPKVTNSTDPENGRVTSVGELGYVSTGLSANPSAATAAAGGSVSWRTLRLQASYYPMTNVLPDWAFADLFAVPNATLSATTTTTGQTPTIGQDIHDPHGNTVGGRVNINSAVVPFTDVTHDRALVGLLYNANDPVASAYNTTTGKAGTPQPYSPSVAETIAQNIAMQNLVTKTSTVTPKKYGAMALPNTPLTGSLPAYDTPGELCEIAKIGDQGEAGEDLIRQISSLTCTRGDVFSVYTIGQTLQQGSTGKLTVTAEQRQQSMVERYVANRNTPSQVDDQVRFRPVYVRNLTP